MIHFIDIEKANPYHDEKGRFATSSSSKLPVKPSKNYNFKSRTDFKKRLETGWLAIPKSVRDLMVKAKVEIRVGPLMSDIDPSLKGKTPRGWDKEDTWDACDGFATREKKSTYIAITENTSERGITKASNRAQVIITHEIAHILDMEDRIGGVKVTTSKEFREAYEADVKKLNKSQKSMFAYELQEGSAGREETFATVFSRLSLKKASVQNRRELPSEDGFPTVAKFIENRYFKEKV